MADVSGAGILVVLLIAAAVTFMLLIDRKPRPTRKGPDTKGSF
jgi:hypothetical protein